MELMRKTLCDVGHTDMSDLPYCFFSPGITKGAKINHEVFGHYERPERNHEVFGITKGSKKIMKVLEVGR